MRFAGCIGTITLWAGIAFKVHATVKPAKPSATLTVEIVHREGCLMRLRDFRFNKMFDSLPEKLDALLIKVNRGEDPSPECPVCKAAGQHGKMVKHTRRGAVCQDCGSRVW